MSQTFTPGGNAPLDANDIFEPKEMDKTFGWGFRWTAGSK